MNRDRYHPREFEEPAANPVSPTLLNEPVRGDVQALRPGAKQRPLHQVLVESLNNTQALLARLEQGITVPRNEQRETIRELYVQTRAQVKALAAVLGLEGIE